METPSHPRPQVCLTYITAFLPSYSCRNIGDRVPNLLKPIARILWSFDRVIPSHYTYNEVNIEHDIIPISTWNIDRFLSCCVVMLMAIAEEDEQKRRTQVMATIVDLAYNSSSWLGWLYRGNTTLSAFWTVSSTFCVRKLPRRCALSCYESVVCVFID